MKSPFPTAKELMVGGLLAMLWYAVESVVALFRAFFRALVTWGDVPEM